MHVVIVEDEPIVANRVQRLSTEILGDKLGKLKWFNNVDDALDYIDKQPIDLMLLDLNINGRDGFELLKTAVAGAFQTIIISAYAEQAIKAFEYGVLDFVNKPFSKVRLQRALNRFLDHESKADHKAKYLAIKQHHGIELISIKDIIYLQGANIYSDVILNNATRYLHDKSLNKLMMILPPTFERVHKSYIVNMTNIKRLNTHKGSKNDLELINGEIVPVGRTYYKNVQQYYN